MIEISKGLLSEVLHYDVYKIHIKNNTLEYDCDFDDVLIIRNINIYELAHKCKEWAAAKYMPICSKTTRQGGIAKIRKKIDNKNHSNTIFSTEYLHSEPEAIFKACQWILDNKDKK